MKRDARLRGLSSDHHQALVIARSTLRLAEFEQADAAAARALAERYDRELEPHFAIEEEVLLPALEKAGEQAFVQRTLEDHAFLREIAHAAREGRTEQLAAFAERLTAHVRFEERELFPRCEELLTDEVLEEAFRRAPHHR